LITSIVGVSKVNAVLGPAAPSVRAGRPDRRWLRGGRHQVVLRVSKAAEVSYSRDSLCEEHIERFMRPKEYRFIDRLPENNYGKVLKTALREQLKKEAP
jgi:long-chain acyl-CoA synthetase